MKFRLKEDWYTEIEFLGIKEKQKLYDKGHIFISQDDIFNIETPYGNKEFTIEQMEETEIFEKVQDEIYMNITESPDDQDEIKDWRIQLDVRTTAKKLKRIENFLRDNLNDLL